MTRRKCILLMDVGGTALKSALGLEGSGAVEGTLLTVPMPSGGDAAGIEDAIRSSARLQRERSEADGLEICGLGAAVPGPFDYAEGIFRMQHKFASVYGRRFFDLMGEEAIGDCRFVHDVNAALMGEMAISPDGRKGAVALVTLGTGLGFSYAFDGAVQTSPTGSPAVPLYKMPFLDGIIEDYVSKRGIMRTYSILSGKEAPPVKEIAGLAAAGDGHSLDTFAITAAYLGDAMKDLVNGLGIERLVFGGRISRAFPFMESELRSRFGSGVALSRSRDIDGAVFKGLASLFSEN